MGRERGSDRELRKCIVLSKPLKPTVFALPGLDGRHTHLAPLALQLLKARSNVQLSKDAAKREQWSNKDQGRQGRSKTFGEKNAGRQHVQSGRVSTSR
eukprot:scaffold6885_cov110-Isochrysis_galbana.AAC.6